MDSYVANEYFEKNPDRVLRLDPYIIQRMGLIKNRVILKIEEFYLNCVPFEIGTTRCQAITILDAREIEFFQQFLEGTHKINFVFMNPLFSKELTIPVLIHIKNFKQYNEESRYCLVDMQFIRLSHEFKEIVATQMIQLDKLKKAYEDESLSGIVMQPPLLKQLMTEDHVNININGQTRSRAKMTRLSLKDCCLFCECPGHDDVDDNTLFELEWSNGNRSFLVKAHRKEMKPAEGIPDYFLIDFDLEYSPGWVEALLPALNKYRHLENQKEQPQAPASN